jgi:hypothetical protein
MDTTRRWRVATGGIVRMIRRHRLDLEPAGLETRAGLLKGAVGAIESGERELWAWEYAIERVAGMELGAIARMAEPMVMGMGVTGEDDRTPGEVWWERMGRIDKLEELLEGLETALVAREAGEGQPVTVTVGDERVAIPPGVVELYRGVGEQVREERGAYLRLLHQMVGTLGPRVPRNGRAGQRKITGAVKFTAPVEGRSAVRVAGVACLCRGRRVVLGGARFGGGEAVGIAGVARRAADTVGIATVECCTGDRGEVTARNRSIEQRGERRGERVPPLGDELPRAPGVLGGCCERRSGGQQRADQGHGQKRSERRGASTGLHGGLLPEEVAGTGSVPGAPLSRVRSVREHENRPTQVGARRRAGGV